MTTRKYGTVQMNDGFWIIETEPQVAARLKRLFPRIKTSQGTNTDGPNKVRLKNNPETCRELEWFLLRYPMNVHQRNVLEAGSFQHRNEQERLSHILATDYQPTQVEMARPLRDYQAVAVNLFHSLRSGLLVGDDVGLGKTAVAIGACAIAEARPALIVCSTNLVRQWSREQIPKFLPDAKVHVIKQRANYDLPPADFYVVTYSKLSYWDTWFRTNKIIRAVVYDEIQELRRDESDKWQAAKNLTEVIPYRLGLSATPVYNYGSEMFNVMTVLKPDCLGDRDEFIREWCVYRNGHHLVKDPAMFGCYLRDNFLMLARKRSEVGRELPPIEEIVVPIEHDPQALRAIQDDSLALARRILTGTFVERGAAAREFDWRLRQATGIAKAPFVAEFVKMIACKEKVLVFAWHREVYAILIKILEEFKPVCWTGEESDSQKDASKQAFIHGDSQVLLMSQRSAAGIDGLQNVCQVIVHAELDWSPQVHYQNNGRLARDRDDGTFNKVTVFFPLSDSGSDPVVSELLGLKASQSSGIMNTGVSEILQSPEAGLDRIKSLAIAYLQKHGETITEIAPSIEGATETPPGNPGACPGPEEGAGNIRDQGGHPESPNL